MCTQLELNLSRSQYVMAVCEGPSFDSNVSAHLSHQKMWFMDTVLRLPCAMNETLNQMAYIAAHLNAEIILQSWDSSGFYMAKNCRVCSVLFFQTVLVVSVSLQNGSKWGISVA